MADGSVKIVNPIEKYCKKLSRYHYFVFFFIFLSKTPIFWHILNLIFLSPKNMDYYCNITQSKPPVKQSDLKNMCPCDEPWWDRSVFTATMQTKYKTICDDSWLVSFSQSMAYAGALVGAMLFGFLSDRFGRLFVFAFSCLVIAVSGCLITVMPTAAGFTFMRFIEGIGVGGAIVTSYVYCIEYCGVHHREIVTALFHLPLNFGHVTLPGISYLLRNFDHFQMVISIPLFFFASLYFLLKESPKWLMDRDHIDKLTVVIQKITAHKIPKETIEAELATYITIHAKNTNRNVKFWEIFKHRRLTLNLGCMIITYFVCGMGYYGVAQFIGQMSGNIHLNVAISGALLIPGTLMCIILLRVISRRNFLLSSNILAGVFILCVIATPLAHSWIRVSFACISLCLFFVAFIIVFLYAVELFPTSIRSSVLGFLSVMSRLGQIVNPPINSLSEIVAGAIFGVMAILSGLLCFLLPETMNTELPSSLEDTKIINQRGSKAENRLNPSTSK